jgi:hypothetical protein
MEEISSPFHSFVLRFVSVKLTAAETLRTDGNGRDAYESLTNLGALGFWHAGFQ